MMMLVTALWLAAQAQAAPVLPPAFRRLVDCRTIAGAPERLACFDRESAAVQEAADRRDIIVVDRQQVRLTRRTLFGLSMPRIPFLGADDGDGPDTVEDSIRSFSADRTGKWVVGLTDAVWQTTEVDEYQSTPRVGEKVVIRRGSLGSYILSVEKRRGVRAIRLR